MTGFRYTFRCIFCLSLLILSTAAQEAKHCAYEPIQKPAVPAENGVDFLLERAAKAKGVEQNPEADRYTLLRRVSLNLTGLPQPWPRLKPLFPTTRRMPTKRWSTGSSSLPLRGKMGTTLA